MQGSNEEMQDMASNAEVSHSTREMESKRDVVALEDEFVEVTDTDDVYDEEDDDIELEENPSYFRRFMNWTCCGAIANRLPWVEKIRKPVWAFFDDPGSSRAAQIWSFFIIILIIVSVVMFMIETLPKFTKDPEPTFFYIETVIVAVFTFEFIMRIISAPDKVLFVLGVLNWVDFLAIAPYYIELAFVGTPGLAWIRVLRLTRVFRIFKVGRYQYGFLLFYFTFKGSVETLFMGLVFILLGIILFGSFMYYAEQTEASFDDDCTCWIYDDDSLNPGGVSPYQSIPHTFWWCIVTMTTVGYGDHFPITPLGKTVAGITFLSGLLIIAFPIAILGNKFLDLYLEQEERNKAEVRKRKEARFAVHPNERYHHLTDPVENVAQEVDTCKDLIREIHSLLSDLDAKQEEVNRALSLFNVKHNKDLVEVEIQRR